jgi:Zn-dependent protease
MRVLGFPVHVRPGFLVFLLIVVYLYGGSLGWWAAGAIAFFTLVHELGHALAARRTGATAEISLDFLAGYASYLPSRPLSSVERIAIAAAGPFAQLALGVVVLVALGVSPFDIGGSPDSEVSIAVWWAGIGLALVNLVPVLPLDGGTIVANTLEAVLPGRGQRIAATGSLMLSGAGIVAVAIVPSLRPFTFLVALLFLLQLQMLPASRRRAPTTGAESSLPHPGPSDIEDAAHRAAEEFTRSPNTRSAVVAARCAGALGEHELAVSWLKAAHEAATEPALLIWVIAHAPELEAVRMHPLVNEIRDRLRA